MKTTSSYRFIGGFGILVGINLYIAHVPWSLFPDASINPFLPELWQHKETILAMLFFCAFLGIFVLLLMTQCKFIITTDEGIKFINPLLPFLRKTRKWSDYDYFHIVQESSTWASYESIWFIKDNVLKERISSFYYSNYEEIKGTIKTENRGELEISQYRQLLCWFGKKIKN